MDTAVPDFFERFPMLPIAAAGLDAALEAAGNVLVVLFLWGRNCPNCDLAKRAILADPAGFVWPRVCWLHDNVYGDPDMANRFGLHGVPTFVLFHRGRRLGRITGWPGAGAFRHAVSGQLRLAGLDG